MDDGVVALTGRSASGKTTILRLIAGLESPVEGRVLINGQEIKVGNEQRKCPSWMMVGSTFAATSTKMVQPVIIASKPDFDNSQTVLQRMYQMGHDAVQFHSTTQNIGSQVDEKRDELLQKLALEFAHTLELTKEYQSCKPVDLSPSRQFLLAIACCCMVSVAPSVASLDPKNKQGVSIPYPILLFDELFDFEHSSTVAKCKEPILNLIQKGGVVVSVTHRQTYFMDMTSRSVTLSGGKVLSDLQMEMNIDLKDHRIYKS
jgi:ABC-type thiamine transport system ATPase subunit